MTIRTFYSLKALIDHANKRLDGFDTVSIDIFDTLFVRRIHDPDMVKFPVARYVATRAEELGIVTTWQKVLETRNTIEAEHRQRSGQVHPDSEVRYDDYMSKMLEQVFGKRLPKDILKDVADYEMSVEDSVIVVRAPLLDWIKHLGGQNKRVFLISDIYLPSVYLKDLVQRKGLSDYVEDVISSADTFKAKASGAAYPLMEDKYNLSRDKWIHIGDNRISDGIRPHAFGIDALVLRDIREKQRLGIARSLAFYSTQKYFWRGRNVQHVMLPLESENQQRDPLYIDGYNFFGFLIANFIHRLIERCKAKRISRVYFCSREGWIFFECWKRMVNYFYPTGGAPEASYLYVSRLALANAACGNKGLTSINARAALLPAESRDFRDICRVFSLDIEPLGEYLKEVGIAVDEDLYSGTPKERIDRQQRFSVLLGSKDFQDEVHRQGRASLRALERYLEDEGFFDQDDVAFVDIGWLGTIQHFLSSAISNRKDSPRIHGFLLVATRLMPYENDYTNYVDGLLFDRFRFDLPGSSILYIKDNLEEICRAPHPSLMAYQLEGDQTILKFREFDDNVNQTELRQNEYYAPLHHGIKDAAERYAIAINLFDYSTEQLKPWINFLLLSRVAFPRLSEIKRIQHLVHQDDFRGKYKVPKRIIRQNLGLWDRSPWLLRFNPFIRIYHLWQHLLRMLKFVA